MTPDKGDHVQGRGNRVRENYYGVVLHTRKHLVTCATGRWSLANFKDYCTWYDTDLVIRDTEED
jgi:hypothetical protein